jgi:hypothetical protein
LTDLLFFSYGEEGRSETKKSRLIGRVSFNNDEEKCDTRATCGRRRGFWWKENE